MHHGVYVTQNTKRLERVTHTTLTVENGKVVDRKAENIAIRGQKNTNEVVGALVEFISRNPYFQRVLAQADVPFETYEELGNMMCDAFIAEGKADLSFQNAGGVRYEKHDVGDITV
jgi:5'-nucleotidase